MSADAEKNQQPDSKTKMVRGIAILVVLVFAAAIGGIYLALSLT